MLLPEDGGRKAEGTASTRSRDRWDAENRLNHQYTRQLGRLQKLPPGVGFGGDGVSSDHNRYEARRTTIEPIRHRRTGLLVGSLFATLTTACGSPGSDREILVGSTTSVYDTGLLDVLVPAFASDHPGYAVKVMAVGSGEALALGRRKDVDLVLAHSPQAERLFMEEGHGLGRSTFMHNDFVVAGPPADPAAIRGMEVGEALWGIATAGARFLSRGDDSGTHRRELELWRRAGIEPGGAWYEDIGQGMAATLLVAGEREAYVLADRATYVSLADRTALAVLVSGDEELYNAYSVIEVSGASHPFGACLFARWLRGKRGMQAIAEFGRDRFGGSLFVPLTEAVIEESPAEARSTCGTRTPAP